MSLVGSHLFMHAPRGLRLSVPRAGGTAAAHMQFQAAAKCDRVTAGFASSAIGFGSEAFTTAGDIDAFLLVFGPAPTCYCRRTPRSLSVKAEFPRSSLLASKSAASAVLVRPARSAVSATNSQRATLGSCRAARSYPDAAA